jgi:hypothetical protein
MKKFKDVWETAANATGASVSMPSDASHAKKKKKNVYDGRTTAGRKFVERILARRKATEAVDPKVGKAVQGLNNLGNKMKGQDAKQVKRIEGLFRKGNKKVMQGALRAMDTDLRDQIQDVLEPLGFWKNGVVDF